MWPKRLMALGMVLALTAVACVGDNPAEPGVRSITTDLKYKQLRESSAAPPNTVPSGLSDLPLPTIPPLRGSPLGPVVVTPEVCPTAKPTEQADEDVTGTVTRLPQEGEYLWKVSGSEAIGEHRVALPEFTKRRVENVEGQIQGESAEFTFETVERELTASNPAPALVRSTFSVTSETATDNTVRPGMGLSSGRTSTAGVRLTGIERQVPGGETTTFVPNQRVRYLITPVLLGPERFWMDQVFDTSGSEPQSLVHRAYPKSRITIDACGERLRGWLVVADQTYQRGSESVSRHFEYAVATQLGGIVIFEHVESPCTRNDEGKCDEGEPALVFDANLGKQLPTE